MALPDDQLKFLDGGGDMGRRVRSYDWAKSPLGPPQNWPSALKTLVGVMLGANQPMFVAWGQARGAMIYNDAYAAMIGRKHPDALGRDFLNVFPEIEADLVPMVDAVYRGEAIHMDDIALNLDRDGVAREAHFAFSYTPVRNDTGAIVGLYCVATETTEQVGARRRLVAERERLAGWFQKAPGFIAVFDGPEHRFEFVNESYRQVAGERQFEGATIREVFPDLEGQAFFDMLDQVYTSGEPIVASDVPIRLQADPQSPARDAIIDFVYQPITDDAGKVTGIFVEGQETTERAAAEHAVRSSEARFRAAVTAVRGVVWTNSADGEMLGEQLGWSALTGQSQAEYEGYGWADAVHPDDARATIDAWNEAVGERRPFEFEHRVRRHDGVWRRFHIRAIPTFDEKGEITEWIGVHTDITDERAAQDALRESEAQFRGVAEALPGFVWTADEKGMLTYTSPRWHAYSGSTPEVSLGAGWAAFVHPEDQPRAFDQWASSLTCGEPYEVEFRLRAADGSYHWWLARASKQTETGDWIGTATELDAIVAARETLSRSRQELERLVAARTAELRDAEEQLRQSQKLEAIGQLTGGVAHDFNNLLTVIRGSVDLLRRPGITEERRDRYIEAISDTVTRAAKLTGQLLAFARRQALKPDVFDVVGGIAGIRDMLGTLSGSRVHVEMDLPDEALFVDADPSQFDTAIVNMAANARDAMAGEGTLTIGVRAVGDSVAVSVTDTGTGIAHEVQAQIFEPFFTTKGVGQGTGLGLSQVYGFAMQSGGDVQLRSAIGEGATFTLSLPRVPAPTEASSGTSDQPNAIDGQGICVLVVEDNPEVGQFAKQTLAELGFATVFAENGPIALAELAEGDTRIDVVFSDVMMPGMTGLELGEEIRRRHPGLPVVLTSGYSHVLAQQGSAGFDLLQKPYSMDQLSQTLLKAARRRQQASA
jgi:PAS domain S-box-containing protein